MKKTISNSMIWFGGGLMITLVAVISLSLIFSPNATKLDPIEINFDAYTLRNETTKDLSNQMEYFYDKVHVGRKSYVIGANVLANNLLPVIRQLDDEGNLESDYYFGLDTLTMDPNTFSGDVNQLVYWPARNTFVVMVDYQPRYTVNGEEFLLPGPLGSFLDSNQNYGLYLRVVFEWNPSNLNLKPLYLAGELTEENPFYDLSDVIPDGETLLLGFEYDANQHTLPFAIDNPRPTGEGTDYVLQRFTYHSNEPFLRPVVNAQWIIASDFDENTNVQKGSVLYQDALVVKDYLTYSIRGYLPNGVERDNFSTWLTAFSITGFDDRLNNEIRQSFAEQFSNFDEDEFNFSPVFDVVVVLDVEHLTIHDFILEVDLPFAGKIYEAHLLTLNAAIYLGYSIRYYGNDPITDESIEVTKTMIYEVGDDGFALLEVFSEEQGFYTYGMVLTTSSLLFYGYQTWGLTESGYFDHDVKLMRYELASGDYEDIVLNSSDHDYAFSARVNLSRRTLDVYAYVMKADEDFASLSNPNPYAMTVVIAFALI